MSPRTTVGTVKLEYLIEDTPPPLSLSPKLYVDRCNKARPAVITWGCSPLVNDLSQLIVTHTHHSLHVRLLYYMCIHVRIYMKYAMHIMGLTNCMFVQSFNSRKGRAHRSTNPLGISIWDTLRVFLNLIHCAIATLWYQHSEVPGEHACPSWSITQAPIPAIMYSPKTNTFINVDFFCT